MRLIAYLLASLAGYVDANGFLMTRGYFVSFMSGNSTQLGVALPGEPVAAAKAGLLIAAFVVGVMAGAVLRRMQARRPEAVILGLLTAVLVAAAGLAAGGLAGPAAVALAFAMGAENTVFAEGGEVRVSLTYMTGALVKCGKAIVAAAFGGERLGWAPHLLLWLSLVTGAMLGAAAFANLGAAALWAAAGAAGIVALVFLIGVPARVEAQEPPVGRAG
jgi:uncharacterized membrane protein YoaK (UPF0700 family)